MMMTKLELRTYFAAFELRIIILEQQFLELRYNHNHDSKGRFTFSSGGGASSGKRVDKSRESGIIESGGVAGLEQAKKRDHKILITDIAVDKIPKKNIPELTKEQNMKIYKANKSVLQISKEKNDSNEVANLIYLFSDKSFYQLGKESSVDILQNPNAYTAAFRSKEKILFLSHNHPSTQNFSYSDIGVLLRLDSLLGMSVVTNAGDVHILYKTDKYYFDKAYEYIKAVRSEYEVYNAGVDTEIVKRFLKDSKSVGIILI